MKIYCKLFVNNSPLSEIKFTQFCIDEDGCLHFNVFEGRNILSMQNYKEALWFDISN